MHSLGWGTQESQFLLGASFFKSGHYESAVQILTSMTDPMKNRRLQTERLMFQAGALSALGRSDEAVAVASRIDVTVLDDAKRADAMQSIEEVKTRHVLERQVWPLAKDAWSRRDWSDVVTVLSESHACGVVNDETRFALARAQMSLGKWEAALRELESIGGPMAAGYESEPALLRAEALWRLGRPQESRQVLVTVKKEALSTTQRTRYDRILDNLQ